MKSPLKNCDRKLPPDYIFRDTQECAEYGGVTQQALYLAIKAGRLKAYKYKNHWTITLADYEEYRLNKFNRDSASHDGQKIYDISSGKFTPEQASQILTKSLKIPFPKNRVYYEIRLGRLESTKVGNRYVVTHENMIEFIEILTKENTRQFILL